MSGNYFCHVCGGLVDLIKLQPSDVRLCECEKRFARLRAENNRLKAENKLYAAEMSAANKDCLDHFNALKEDFDKQASALKLAREALVKCSTQLTRLGYSANHGDQALAAINEVIGE